jgi:hypothetical protein
MAAELQEALTAAGVAPLIQKVIDPLLLEYQRRYSPLLRVTPTKKISSTVYYFNRRTNRAPGGFVTDGGARPMGNSLYEQFNFTIKQLQAVGGVTGYAQEVTRDQIGDLRAQEIASTMQGLLWDIEMAMLWGNAAATAAGPWPQFDGLDTMVNQFTTSGNNAQNAIDAGGAALSLGYLDQVIDMVETNAAQPVWNDQWMFVMSPTAIGKIVQLETPLQRFLGQTEIAAGLNVSTYRDIPLVKSSFLSSRLSVQMPTVTVTTSGSGGSLAAGTYYYVIEPVIARAGIGKASVEVNSGALTGSTSQVTLSFSVPSGVDGGAPLSYRVYRGTSAGQETLLGVVDAVVTTTGDGITPIYATQIVDTGAALVQQTGSTANPNPLAAYTGGSSSMKPRLGTASAQTEDVWLIPRDPDILLRPYVRDITPLTIYPTTQSPDQLPFALATDTTLALRAPKFVGRLRNVLAALSA